jgi:hypothetical protein
VRSLEPNNLALTVRDLQKILFINQGISAEYCEYQRLKYYNVAISKHFMDLRFIVSG